jgi:DNA-directed RNA polymerase specialized sigma24 family protein
MNNKQNASGQGMVETASDHVFKRPMPGPCATEETSEVFDYWFARCRGSLHLTACHVLGVAEGADLAVWNCWLTASRNRPTFDHEGAFRSWLLRVLIDEASAILQGHLHRRLDYDHTHLYPLHRSCPR